MGRRHRKGRAINGIFLLNKATGITSNTALQQIKRLFNAAKAGHTGSLDPLASGMLPLCLGEATKFSQFLLNADKRYQVTAKLGVKTATGDSEGEIIEEHSVAVTESQLQDVLVGFRGDIQQVPSMYSALKHQGQPLYKLARQGIEVERKARPISIYRLTLLHFADDEIQMDIHCSKGTYIRTLVEDIGDLLGCGAHVTALHRVSVGPYEASQMLSLEEAEAKLAEGMSELDATLLPVDSAVSHWPEVKLSSATVFYVKQGQPVLVPRSPSEGWVRLTNDDNFIGVGEILDDGRVAPKRLIAS